MALGFLMGGLAGGRGAWGQEGGGTDGAPAAVAAPANEMSDSQVLDSMMRGVDYLFAIRDEKTKRWERRFADEKEPNYGGETCMTVFALLHVGENSADRRLRAFSEELKGPSEFVINLKPKSTYAASLQLSALNLMPKKPEVMQAIERTAKVLAMAQQKNGAHTYSLDVAGGNAMAWDNSNTQYANLGMWAALDSGVPVGAQYWKLMESYWRETVGPGGGWGYRDRTDSTVAFTSAGIAGILIASEQTDRALRLQTRKDELMEKAMSWLGKNFSPANDGPYALYAVERAGLLSGMKFMERRNWFVEGAKHIVATQQKDGGWVQGIHGVDSPAVTTSFSLLFLARGRNPVLFNKLQYDGNWNPRARDLASLAAQVSREFERPFNWQVVSFNVDTDEWLDAPALLITGTADPAFSPRQVEQLREYVGNGGMIFSVAVGDKKEAEGFNTTVPKYAELITGNATPMRELPADHVLYSLRSKLQNPPKLLGLSNGVRELWVHCPVDLGATWHLKQKSNRAAFDLPANVYFYACGKEELRTKLSSTAVKKTAARPARNITVGRLKYAGHWDPEFGAWERLSRVAQAKFRTQLDTVPMTVEELSLDKAKILWMTGSEKFEFTKEEVAKLKAYIEGGGVLAADAAGGSKEFAESFLAMCKVMYPEGVFAKLGDKHSLYTGAIGDSEVITAVKYRPLTEQTTGKTTSPRIYGMDIPKADGSGKRLGIVYSPMDMTCGFAGVRAWGVDGYSIESAEMVGRNLLLYLNVLTK